MKVKDKTTGTFKEVYVKALDSLPVGSEIDFEGTDIPTGWEQVANPDSYSAEEVKTNKIWIDGKPIYRKVFVIQNPTTDGSEQEITIDTSINDIVKIDGYIHGNNNELYPAQYINPYVSDAQFFNLKSNIGNHTLNYSIGSAANGGMAYIIIEYTKTTD